MQMGLKILKATDVIYRSGSCRIAMVSITAMLSPRKVLSSLVFLKIKVIFKSITFFT